MDFICDGTHRRTGRDEIQNILDFGRNGTWTKEAGSMSFFVNSDTQFVLVMGGNEDKMGS